MKWRTLNKARSYAITKAENVLNKCGIFPQHALATAFYGAKSFISHQIQFYHVESMSSREKMHLPTREYSGFSCIIFYWIMTLWLTYFRERIMKGINSKPTKHYVTTRNFYHVQSLYGTHLVKMSTHFVIREGLIHERCHVSDAVSIFHKFGAPKFRKWRSDEARHSKIHSACTCSVWNELQFLNETLSINFPSKTMCSGSFIWMWDFSPHWEKYVRKMYGSNAEFYCP